MWWSYNSTWCYQQSVLRDLKEKVPRTHSDGGNNLGLCRPPDIYFIPHLHPNLTTLVTSAPDLLKKKIALGSLQGPTEDHVKLLHLLQGGHAGLSAIWGSGRWGGGGGQCHTKGGQEGKISHPWSVRQRTLILGVRPFWSCEEMNTSCRQRCHPNQLRALCWEEALKDKYVFTYSLRQMRWTFDFSSTSFDVDCSERFLARKIY